MVYLIHNKNERKVMNYLNYKVLEGNSCAGGLAEVTNGVGSVEYAVGSESYKWVGETAEERHALKQKQWFYRASKVFATEAEARELYDSKQASAMAYFDRYGTANE